MQKTPKSFQNSFNLPINESGGAFLAVLILTVIMSIVITSVMVSSRVSTKRSGERREGVSLISIAEAGKEDGIAKIKSGSVTPSAGVAIGVAANGNFGGGSYTVRCSANVALDTLWLTSRAKYVDQSKGIEVIYKVTSSTISSAAFNNGISAGGGISWSGSGAVIASSASIFCNGFFNMTGSSDITANIFAGGGLNKTGSTKIIGNVTALSVTQSGSGTISGTITLGTVAPLTIPDIDLTPYYNYALAQGQVYNSNQHITGSTNYVVPGGVMWVNGTFKRSGSGDFTGCVLATGDVDVSGSGDYFNVAAYPLAVSVHGDVDFSGSGDISGLLYAKNGEFKKTGSGNVSGSIICKGDFKKTGSWSFLNYVNSTPIAPGGSGKQYNMVSWRELSL